MALRQRAVVLGVSAVLALASLLAVPGGVASAAATATSAAPDQPHAYVPLRGAGPGPLDKVFTNLDYNGGPVMSANTNYMVLWSPSGSSAYPAGYVSGLETFFTDLAHDSGGHQNVDSVTAQYNDLTGAFAGYQSKFGGAILDTDAYPTSQCPVMAPATQCLTDPQIQSELEHFVAAHHLTKDLSHEYFLLTPPHVEGCFSGQASANPPYGGCSAGEKPSSLALYCAYHQNTSVTPLLIYADHPYVVGNSGCDDGNHPNGIADGELEGGVSHEHNESVSDPLPNDAWTNGAGANQGQENGDQCDGQMGTPLGTHNGAQYNQVINGHFYWFQEEWSNQGHACLQRLTPATARPVAAFSVTPGSGLALNFDASGSSAAGGIADFVWQFNDANGAQTVEQTTSMISHTFPSAGAYSIGLTIYGQNGISAGNGGIVRTGQSGLTPGFSFLPTNPAHGNPVKFSALSTVSAQPVMVYLWEFGDGQTGSGISPKHTYRKAGLYRVILVMFSGVGSAFPGTGAGPVSTLTVRVT